MNAVVPEDQHKAKRAPEGQNAEQAEVDEALEESFPASDPPNWTLGRNHGEETTEPEEKA